MKDYLQVGDLVEAASFAGVIVKIVATDAGNRYHIGIDTKYETSIKVFPGSIVYFEDGCMVLVMGPICFIETLTPEQMMTFGHEQVRKLGKKLLKHRARWRWWYESKWYPRWMNIWKHV